MTTKDYLWQLKRLRKRIDNKAAEVYKLKSMAYSITIAPSDSERVQTSTTGDRIGSAVAKIVDLENEISDEIDLYTEKRNHILNQIENIGNDEYVDVLTHRFVLEKDFDDIPDEIHMSRRKMFYIYREAMDRFEELYGSEYK